MSRRITRRTPELKGVPINAVQTVGHTQVRHLLEHRGGWDRDKSFDAMFQSVRFAKELGTNAPADQAAVIKSMFFQQLDYAPGERYAYSNFGYCLLGRVIEKLSGQTYESYVRDHILAPILRPLLPRLIIPIRACSFVRNRLT